MSTPEPNRLRFTIGRRQSSPGAGRLVGKIFAGIGLLIVGIAVYLWFHERAFLARAEHTRGLVVAMREQWSSSHSSRASGPTYSPTFTFADKEGREHRVQAHTGTNPPAYRVGENVDVFYAPEDPDHAQLRGFFSQWGAALICGALGTFFFLFGALFVFLFRRDDAPPVAPATQ